MAVSGWTHPARLARLLRARSVGHRVEWRPVFLGKRHVVVLVRERAGTTSPWPARLQPVHFGGCPRAEPCLCGVGVYEDEE